MNNRIKVSDHINTDHKEFAIYANLRSIPNIVDGLKPSQRKVIYTVIKSLSDNTEIKVSNIGSRASDMCHYQHGEVSIIDTVVNLARDFIGSNNCPWLEKDGQFGTRMDHKNAEPRYIYIRKGKNLKSILNFDHDLEILNKQHFETDEIEPQYFVPTLPMILVNGSVGIGNAYSCTILPRSTKSIIKAIKKILNDSDHKPFDIPPAYDFKYHGDIKGEKKTWKIEGKFVRESSTQIRITDLPPDSFYQYDSYKDKVLVPLIDKKLIKGFYDQSKVENEWNILIEAPRSFVSLTDEELSKHLRLTLNVTENLTCWNPEYTKLIDYPSAYALLIDWIGIRLEWYNKRIQNEIDKIQNNINIIEQKQLFIQFWNDNHNHLVKCKTKKDIIGLLNDHGLESLSEYIDSLRVYHLTTEHHTKLEQEKGSYMEELNFYRKTSNKELMLNEIESTWERGSRSLSNKIQKTKKPSLDDDQQ